MPDTVLSTLQVEIHLALPQHSKVCKAHYLHLQMRKMRPERLIDWPTSSLPGGVCVLTDSWLQTCSKLASGSSLAPPSLTLNGCYSRPGLSQSHLWSLSGRIWQQLLHDIRSCLVSKLSPWQDRAGGGERSGLEMVFELETSPGDCILLHRP